GWIVAPGMQGVAVQPLTANMLTPESLSELMGGPDIVPPPAPDHFGPSPLPGPPNAYNENNPLPPPWYPQPGPPPAPGPGVIPGDPGGAMNAPAAPGPAPAAPAPAGPPLPAEAGGQ
ncbi:MAG: mce2D, partial [Mycobacterium sp.]|nr:mce2D [Mycobacterium sp.]